MNKPLTEEELRTIVADILNRTSNLGSEGRSANIGEIVELINSQKVAHADRVIGIDNQIYSPDGGKKYEAGIIRNNLRAKQRGRNK